MIPVYALQSSPIVETSEPEMPVMEMPADKPRVWTVFAAWISAVIMGWMAVIAGFIGMGVVMGIMMGIEGMAPEVIEARVGEAVQQPLPVMLLTLLPFQFGMLLVAMFAGWRSKTPLKERLGLTPSTGRMFGRMSLATMAAFTLSAALASLFGSVLLLGEPPANPLGETINQGSLWTLTLVSLILSVVPSIAEEILFRGYMQRRMLQRWSPAVAIGVSTLLFALVHADSLQHIIAVVPLGLVLGMLAYRTGSVKPGMLVHALHNLGAVGFATLVRELAPTLGDEGLGLLLLGTIGLLALIGLPAIIWLLRRTPMQDDLLPHMHSPIMDSLAGQTM